MNRRFQRKFHHCSGKKQFHNKKNFPLKKNFYNRTKVTGGNDAQGSSLIETMNRLKETDVGITEYVSEYEGFSGVIKQRYADFHVNEIDCDGKIVTLTTTTPPEVEGKQDGAKHEDIEERLKSIVTPDVLEKLKMRISQNEGDNSDIEIEVTEMSKDDRKNVHIAIKAFGSGKLVSNTKQKDEKKFIVIYRHDSKVKSDRREEWPAAYGGDYVHFALFKENMDTMETVNLIASKLRIKPNMITYAGTKDRRAITTQMMSVRRVNPKTLAKLSSGLRGVSLGNYAFKPKGLKLGDLHGNCFRIVLRNITGNDIQIEQSMQSLSEKGFVNYYGLQRFGSSVDVPTHTIGKALLQGNWKLAVELILKPREGEVNVSLGLARKIWWATRDAKKALENLPNKEKFIEGKLLLGLSQCAANDYINALEKIPRNTRLMYLHSYQSLLWNKVVSRRVRELGLKPLPGDLVFVNETQKEDMYEDAGDVENDNHEYVDKLEKKSKVRVISEKDIENIHIHDIVMPLPGHDVIYPQNMKDWYEDLLKVDGLSSANLKQTVRKYSVSGTYRKMVIRPDNLSWKTMRYSDPLKALQLSDFEKMKNIEPPKEELDGTYKALILNFCLPSSTYATMALREILKSDTSCQHQASLNDYHVQKTENKAPDAPEENISCATDVCKVVAKDMLCNSSTAVTEDNEEESEREILDKCVNEEPEVKSSIVQNIHGIEKKFHNENQKREAHNADDDTEKKKIKLDSM